jgi:aminoglycoside phosphotransferase (APT) family kinase protein
LPISGRNLPGYLRQHGTDLAEPIVAGSVSVVEIALRNRTFLVQTSAVEGFVVKTGNGEVSGPPWIPLRTGSSTLRETMLRGHLPGEDISRELGRRCADLHRTPVVEHEPGITVRNPVQTLIALVNQPARGYVDQSFADLDLIRSVQRHTGFLEALLQLNALWEPSALIHSDLTWDNILVLASNQHESHGLVEFIDWESSGSGDPCWDVGTLLSEFVVFWAMSIPVVGGEPYDTLAKHPITDMHPVIATFWASYARELMLDRQLEQKRLLRSVRYAGARLILSAYEQTQTMTSLTPHVYLLLQLSLNIMERPEEATRQLFGLSPERPAGA